MKSKHRKAARAKREILTGMTSFEQTIRGCKTPDIDEQILILASVLRDGAGKRLTYRELIA